jgi:hypothetical protein
MARTKTAAIPTHSAAEAAIEHAPEIAPADEAGAATQEPRPAAKDAAAAERSPAEGERRPFPDVSEQKTVLVSPDGDKLRLLQSRRFNQLQISHDGAIPDWAKERLKADGWRDRVEDEGIYTKQLPPRAQPGEEDQGQASSRRRAGYEADRFFEQLANDIRADRGLSPIRLGGAAVAER